MTGLGGNRGRFITLEGGEGAGKSTQARLLADALTDRGIRTVLSREPGGTPGAEAIRALLLDPAGEGFGVKAEALLFAAARADHVERIIAPALREGKWVICDRFVDSNRAYQGGGGGVEDKDLMTLHRFGSDGLLPDRTFLIAVDPEVSAVRVSLRDGDAADRIGGRDARYHTEVASKFSDLADAEPQRFTRIDGNGAPASIHAQIWESIVPLLPKGEHG